MVAYNFKSQFVAPIMAGTKRQTIRADRKRHARPREPLQLYTGMRTRQCRLVGLAHCLAVEPISIDVDGQLITLPGGVLEGRATLDLFALADGFLDWPEMAQFWRDNHSGAPVFSGVLVRWFGFKPSP